MPARQDRRYVVEGFHIMGKKLRSRHVWNEPVFLIVGNFHNSEALESYAKQGQTILLDWITTLAAYAQIGLLVAAYLRALVLSAWMGPRIDRPIRPAQENQPSFAAARRFALMFPPLLLPVLAYALLPSVRKSRDLFLDRVRLLP